MERGKGYGIRIERHETRGVIIYLTHDGVDTGTSFAYMIDHVTLEDILHIIRSWYMHGALDRIEDRDKLIEDAKQLWLLN